MGLAIFFLDQIIEQGQSITLPEETSRHIIGVLRMNNGDQLQLTDGKGNLITASITSDHKKKCVVVADRKSFQKKSSREIVIAISLLKNASRFEWFLEKATEIGVSKIIPLICKRTEKQFFRTERMKSIMVSAMLQSQQVWLPDLNEPVAFDELLNGQELLSFDQKFIAHCEEDARTSLADATNSSMNSQVILIGPEGDFSTEEILAAEQHHYMPVLLGENRLRTETAGVVAATILRLTS